MLLGGSDFASLCATNVSEIGVETVRNFLRIGNFVQSINELFREASFRVLAKNVLNFTPSGFKIISVGFKFVGIIVLFGMTNYCCESVAEAH